MATPKVRKQVYWQQDERADTGDMLAVQTYARRRSQDTVQFLAGRAPRVGHTGRTWMPYSVWALNGSGITFEPLTDNRIKVAAGLRLALTGGDSGDAGDLIEVSEETILDNYCPSVGAPLLLLMARISTSLVDGDSDDRVFYKTADGTEETRNVATTQRRDINWTEVDATDGAAITVAETAGYQWVAELDYNGGAHQVSAWYYVFPESEVGGGALVESGMSFLWGLKRGLEAAYGGGKVWTDTPDNTLEDDEFHAESLYAGTNIVVGRDNAADTTGDAGRVFISGGTTVLAKVPTGSLPGAADILMSLFGADLNSVFAQLDPNRAISTTHYVDIRAGLPDAALRFIKDAAGNVLLRFLNSAGSSRISLRSDGVIELNQTYEVRVPLDLHAAHYNTDAMTGATCWDFENDVWVARCAVPGTPYDDFTFGWNLTQFNTVANSIGTVDVKRVVAASARVHTDALAPASAVRMYLERAVVDGTGLTRTWESIGAAPGYVDWDADQDLWHTLSVDAAKMLDVAHDDEQIRVRIVPKDNSVYDYARLISLTVTVETLLLPSG